MKITAQEIIESFTVEVKVLKVERSLLGHWMRARRRRVDLSLRAVAKEIKISAAYLSDLELGNRSVSTELLQSFLDATKGPIKH